MLIRFYPKILEKHTNVTNFIWFVHQFRNVKKTRSENFFSEWMYPSLQDGIPYSWNGWYLIQRGWDWPKGRRNRERKKERKSCWEIVKISFAVEEQKPRSKDRMAWVISYGMRMEWDGTIMGTALVLSARLPDATSKTDHSLGVCLVRSLVLSFGLSVGKQ